MSDQELRKEIRSQRHDFLKEYYKMATSDLDRHLKGGWQTIAVLGGGVAVLAAGHEDKIGLPIAVSIAVAAALWGALTVIDSNYWSIRAIAFLSNVEAVYFSKEDRGNFNPYIGFYPKYKLMDSLKYMFWLCVAFAVLSVLSLVWGVQKLVPKSQQLADWVWDLQPLAYGLWIVPIICAAWGGVWCLIAWRTRMSDYREFVDSCPGPGIRATNEPARDVFFTAVDGSAIAVEHPQKDFAEKLTKQMRRRGWSFVVWTTAICLTTFFGFRFTQPF